MTFLLVSLMFSNESPFNFTELLLQFHDFLSGAFEFLLQFADLACVFFVSRTVPVLFLLVLAAETEETLLRVSFGQLFFEEFDTLLKVYIRVSIAVAESFHNPNQSECVLAVYLFPRLLPSHIAEAVW